MMVDVHLRDGRTILRFRTRGAFQAAIKSDPLTLDERRPVKCWRTYEVVQGGTGDIIRQQWEQTACHHLGKPSVANVMAVSDEDRRDFIARFPDAADLPKPAPPLSTPAAS
ncbi:MAG: hypothetical protein ABW167_07780 [Baekduia sp.]